MKDLGQLRWLAVGVILIAALIAVWTLRDLEVRPPRGATTDIGATLAMRRSGHALIVDSLRSDGAARRAGLLVGDRIETIDGNAPGSLEAAEHIFDSRSRHSVHIRRGARSLDLVIDTHQG